MAKCPTCGQNSEEFSFEESSEYEEAHLERCSKVRILMIMPWPTGHPTCMKCGSAEVSHSCVMEFKQDNGETGKGFGCLCKDCAEDLEQRSEAAVDPGTN